MGSKAVAGLKKEFEKLVDALAEEDDEYDSEVTDNAIKTLCALKDLKLNRTDQEFLKLKDLAFHEPPPEFKCPISGILMKDPVVLASGQTYEAASIRKWLDDGHKKCPQTDQLLPHTLLIPNNSIRKMITNWCESREIDTSIIGEDGDQQPNVNRESLIELLEKLSSIPDQTIVTALKELRSLTGKSPYFRSLFGEIKLAIPQLFRPVLIQRAYADVDLHNELVAVIFNIATHDSNKTKIVETSPLAISFLTNSARNKNIETRRNAVAALSVLSSVDSNKKVIGQPHTDTISCLIELVREGDDDPLTLKDAVLTISSLCSLVENRERIIRGGGAVAIMERIIITTDFTIVESMLEIVSVLCGYDQRAMDGVDGHWLLSCLFELLLRGEGNVVSDRGKENCVAIIYAICFGDRAKLRMIGKVENGYEALCRVARSGTSRARRKAAGILERMNRFAFVSYSA